MNEFLNSRHIALVESPDRSITTADSVGVVFRKDSLPRGVAFLSGAVSLPEDDNSWKFEEIESLDRAGKVERKKILIPDWKEVLKTENLGSQRIYILPKSRAEIQLMVAQAVFTTLTGKDLIEAQHRSIGDSMPNENAELTILELMNLEYMAEEAKGFPKEVAEAMDQGIIAASADYANSYQPFRVHYDYWQGVRRIGEEISIDRGDADDHYFVLKAPQSRIGKEIGFPMGLIRREWKAERDRYSRRKAKEAEPSYYERLLNIAAGLGYDRSYVDGRIHESTLYRHMTDIIGYDRIDSILRSHNLPTPLDFKNFSAFSSRQGELLRFVYSRLSDTEKRALNEDKRSDILCSLPLKVVSFNTKARWHINIQISSTDVHFNHANDRMEGDLNHADWYHLDVELRPEISPATKHRDLMALRSTGVPYVENAGLTEPNTHVQF